MQVLTDVNFQDFKIDISSWKEILKIHVEMQKGSRHWKAVCVKGD